VQSLPPPGFPSGGGGPRDVAPWDWDASRWGLQMPPGGGDHLVLGFVCAGVELHLPADPQAEGTCGATR